MASSAPGVKWNDIAGLGDAKELLRENIALPLALPELFTGIRRPVKVRAAHRSFAMLVLYLMLITQGGRAARVGPQQACSI